MKNCYRDFDRECQSACMAYLEGECQILASMTGIDRSLKKMLKLASRLWSSPRRNSIPPP